MSEPSYFSNERAEVAALLPASARQVLEVGCGEGRFARHVAGVESYWGIEPSAAAERARERLDQVLQGTWEQVVEQIPQQRFDLAVCNDVIEHMPDPDAFLRSLKTRLAPGACVVGSVPNVRYLPHLGELLWQRDWRYREAGILDRTHLRFFTQRSLARLFIEHGFVIEQLCGLNDVLVLAPPISRLRWWLTLQLMQLATLRRHPDARFLQIGFRARMVG